MINFLRSLSRHVLALLLLTAVSASATDNQHYNLKAREYMARVQAALGQLARGEPILQGVDVIKIRGVEGHEALLYVQEEFTFCKNTVNKPAVSGTALRRDQVGPGGILIRIGVSDHMPKIETSEVICLNPGAKNRINLYLLVKTYQDPLLAKAILREIEPHTALFIKSLGAPDQPE